MNLLDEMTSITIYTGTNGKKGCTCKCPGCSQEGYGNKMGFYQGKIEQIEALLKVAPNLKKAIILGNPDPNVDPNFCNKVAKLLIKNKVKVRFSTSGFNAENTMKILLNELTPEFVEYISFSIDTVDEEKLSRLKGKKISLKDVERAIHYCNDNGFRTKIQPTLWEENSQDYKKIVEYYGNIGVKWFSFHAGSFESFKEKKENYKHISPSEWRKISNNLVNICKENGYSLHMPYLFMTEEELINYKREFGDKCYPSNLKNTQIWLEDGYIRTTHCPLLREIRNFDYNLYDLDKSKLNFLPSENGFCPVVPYSLGSELVNISSDGQGHSFLLENGEKLYSICRSYNITINL